METTPDKGAKNSGGHSQKKSRREKRSRREEHTPELHRRTEGSQTHHEHQTHTLTDQHVLMTNHDVNPYSRVRLSQETLSRTTSGRSLGKTRARPPHDHFTHYRPVSFAPTHPPPRKRNWVQWYGGGLACVGPGVCPREDELVRPIGYGGMERGVRERSQIEPGCGRDSSGPGTRTASWCPGVSLCA